MAAVMAAVPLAAQTADSSMRKRKQDEPDAEEKPRGRPRKNSKDESAAERRRTQIRLAQRAYRQRKETTIDELRQKVNELTGTIEAMDRSIRDFTTNARRRGLPAHIAQDLDVLLQQLASHVANAKELPKQKDAETSQRSSVPQESVGQGAYIEVMQQMPQGMQPIYPNLIDNAMGLDQQEPLHPAASQRQHGFILDDEPVEEKYHPPLDMQQPQQTGNIPISNHIPLAQNYQHVQQPAQQRKSRNGHTQRPQQYQHDYSQQQMYQAAQQRTQVSILSTGLYHHAVMNPPRTVTPINGLCDYEKSFARRLQRICIEAGYQLLVDPSRAPNAYQRVFRLHLSTGRDRNDLLPRFALHIKRDIHATLDSDTCPFSYVGGAGLHYPDTAGCRRPELGSPEDRVALDVMASGIPGLGGEWLDANDVQGYLAELGIRVDGSAQYVHASVAAGFLSTPGDKVEIDGFLATTSRYHNFEDVEEFNRRFLHLEDACPPQPVPPLSLGQLGHLWPPTANLDLGSLADLMDTPAPHFFSIPGTASYLPDTASSTASGCESQTFSPPLHKADSVSSNEDDGVGIKPMLPQQQHIPDQRVTVTLDVCKLFKVLLLSSVCLGRAPGFRRWHVDAAVRSAVVAGV